MAKATLVTRDGLKITVEGTPDEVAALVQKLEGGGGSDGNPPKRSAPSARPKKATTAKSGPADLLAELIDGGFFKKPKELGSIRLALQEQGHYYPATTLSPVLLRFVRSRRIRRIKDKKRWQYVG
jgi:hypothetical protein